MKLRKRSEYESEAALAAMSEPRHRLAALNMERSRLSAEIKELGEQSARLAGVVSAVEEHRQRLDQFDAAHRAALTRWARGQEPVMPRADASRREALIAALAAAEFDAVAGESAQAELAAEAEAASRRARDLQAEAERLSRVAVVEEMRTLLPQVIAARAEADRLAQLFADARSEVLRGIGFGDTSYGEAQSALEHFENDRARAEAPALIVADGEAWRRFTGALMTDATISFEDAQAIPAPALPPIAAPLDPVEALARSVSSFTTNSIGSW